MTPLTLLNRCTIYKRLEEAGVPIPKYAVLHRDKAKSKFE